MSSLVIVICKFPPAVVMASFGLVNQIRIVQHMSEELEKPLNPLWELTRIIPFQITYKNINAKIV